MDIGLHDLLINPLLESNIADVCFEVADAVSELRPDLLKRINGSGTQFLNGVAPSIEVEVDNAIYRFLLLPCCAGNITSVGEQQIENLFATLVGCLLKIVEDLGQLLYSCLRIERGLS